jgi:hypothetical protein
MEYPVSAMTRPANKAGSCASPDLLPLPNLPLADRPRDKTTSWNVINITSSIGFDKCEYK